MVKSHKNWFSVIRKKLNFHRSPNTKTINLHANSQEASVEVVDHEELASSPPMPSSFGSREDIAAIRIQAMFRGHLARQAFQALRSVVKLQALARGVSVRKQSRIALHCMHALVRLQVRVRARQLLANDATHH